MSQINASEIVNRLLASLVQEVANAVTANLENKIEEIVTKEIDGLELVTAANLKEHLEASYAFGDLVEGIVEVYDIEEKVKEVVRNMDFTIDVD